jgi:hypothetical protein
MHSLGVTIQNPPKIGSNPQQSFNRDPRAKITFTQPAVEGSLILLGLPAATPLSVLAVEILPGPLSVPVTGAGPAPQELVVGGGTATAAAVAEAEDPLGADLGLRRILRTSPLVAVPSIC